MRKFNLVVPVSHAVIIEIEAEDLEAAEALANQMVDDCELDLDGYDYEGEHWVEEE